jgi:hypothetical protein
MPAWIFLISLVQSLLHSILIGPFLQTSPSVILYNPSEYQLITSALKMETACFSETLASANQSA